MSIGMFAPKRRPETADPWPLLWLVGDGVAAFGPPVRAARQEADLGVERVADLRVAESSAEHRVGVEVVGTPCIVGTALRGGRIRAGHEGEQFAVRGGLPGEIEAVGAIEVVGRRKIADALAVDHHGAEVRPADLALHSQDGVIIRGGNRPRPFD
jgi:hypothetical protein